MKTKFGLSLRKTHAFILIIFIALALFCWINISSNVPDAGFNNEAIQQLDGTFTVTCKSESSETSFETTLPYLYEDAHAGDTLTIRRTLSADEIDGNCLLFYFPQAWVNVYLGDEVLFQAEKNPDLPFPLAVGSRWYLFRLPKDFDGKELRIETTAQFDPYASRLPAVYYGTKSSILYYIIYNARFSLLTGIPTLTLGITFFFLGLFLRKKQITDRITLLGMLSIILSIWYMLESQMTQLFFGNLYLWAYVLFSCFYMIPMLVTSLLLTFDTFRNQKYMCAMFWISCGTFCIVQLLQITGITFYISLVPIVHILILLIIAGILFSYIQARSRNRKVKDIYIYKALLALSGFAVADILFYYLSAHWLIGSFIKVGVLFFIVYLTYTGLKQFYEMEMNSIKNEVYHELAVKDLMTGLANRTAFEQEMARLRGTSVQSENIFFFFTDVNNLKTINDTYGHAQGDDCIIKTAHNLTQCFFEPNICYRIGGDEFCVICHGLTENDLLRRKEQIYALVQSQNAQTAYPYSIACGYHVIDEDGADACLKKADTNMYREKSRMKGQNV